MANEIRLFENPEFGQVRTVVIEGEPWFVAADVCKALELSNPSVSLSRLDEDERSKFNLGRQGETNIVNEPGLYSLVLGSRKPEAKAFKRWITHEVIPDIRKFGMYATPDFLDKALGDPENWIRMLTEYSEAKKENQALKLENAEQKETIKEMKPKVTYVDMVLQTPDLVTTTVVAKDFALTAVALNKILHEEGIQYKQGRTWMPYKEYADKGYMKSTTTLYTDGSGEQHSSVLYKWTQKGRLFIYELLAKRDIHPVMDIEAEETDDNVIQLMLN